MTTICIIQARMGSSRLPGKVIRPLLDRPLLIWCVDRVRRSPLVDDIIIATTTQLQDDAIVDLCQRQGWRFFRGSENDVLDRYYQAAREANAETVVRVTSDCPLIEPEIISLLVAAYRSLVPKVDYVRNFMPDSYPVGLGVEVFSFDALERAWRSDDNPAWREHVTEYILHHPKQFTDHVIQNPVNYAHHRWTVDTPEDYDLVQMIYKFFGHGDFHWSAVIDLLENQHPEWMKINAHIQQKSIK